MNIRETDRKIRSILIPVILENALMTLSSMILTGYIGRLSVGEMNVYGITNRMYGICNAIMKGLAIGAMIMMAREFGRNRKDRCHTLLKESYRAFLPVITVIAVLLLVFPQFFLHSMTSDTALLEEGAHFLRYTVIFYPLLAIIHLNTSAFQANGDTKTPLFIAILGNLINIVFGYLLIFVFQFGIYGAAWAQNLSWIAMTCTGLYLLHSEKGLLHGYSYLPDQIRSDLKQIFSAGIPAAVEYSLWSLATIFISRVILSYGQTFYAAYQLGLQAEGFCDMMSAGFLTAAMSLASNAIGAGDDYMYRLYYRRLRFYCIVISSVTTVFLVFFSRSAVALMTDKEELIQIAAQYLTLMIVSQFPQHMQKILFGFIRSSSHTKTPMIINFIGLWMVRVSLAFFFGMYLKLDIVWIWWAVNIDQWIRCILAYILFRKYHVMDYVQQLSTAV